MCGADGYESVEGLSYEDVHSVLRRGWKRKQTPTKRKRSEEPRERARKRTKRVRDRVSERR